MKERTLGKIVKAITGLPFSAVSVKIPEGKTFTAETYETTRNFRKAQIRGDRVKIPTGASANVTVGTEEIDIKDWRGKGANRHPGASVIIGDGEPAKLDSKNDRVSTPGGVEIVYQRD